MLNINDCRRHWRLPPIVQRDPRFQESFEGERVLSPALDESSVLVWQLSRDASLWAHSDTQVRAQLFQPGGRKRYRAMLRNLPISRRKKDAILKLVQVLFGTGDARLAAECCLELGACSTGAAEGVAFATTAMLLAPISAQVALTSGQIAIRCGRTVVGEASLRRAIALGRRFGDRASAAEAYLALGDLRELNGRFPQARHAYMRALRISRRFAVREVRGRAAHRLSRLCSNNGELREAVGFGRLALRLHVGDEPCCALIRVELAELAVREGRRADALALVAGADPALLSKDVRFRREIVRIRSGEDALAAWDAASQVAEQEGETETAAAMLLELAGALEEARESGRADATAVRGVALARRVGASAVCNQLLELITALRRLQPRHPAAQARAPVASSDRAPVSTSPGSAVRDRTVQEIRSHHPLPSGDQWP